VLWEFEGKPNEGVKHVEEKKNCRCKVLKYGFFFNKRPLRTKQNSLMKNCKISPWKTVVMCLESVDKLCCGR
jgi:hypothetical protein